MKLEIKGQRVYDHSAEEIYQIIANLPSIADEFPVIEKIETVGPDEYVFLLNLHLPFTSGTYSANARFKDQNPHTNLSLEGKHKSGIGRLEIELNAQISAVGKSAHELAIKGHLKVGGMIRFAGAGLLKMGMSNGIKTMFDLLETRLEENQA